MSTGRLAGSMDLLRSWLVASPAWNTWCGSTPVATQSIFDIIAPPKVSVFPHVVIDVGPNQTRTRDGISLSGFVATGELWIAFFDRCEMVSSEARRFYDRMDAVMADLEKLANNGDTFLSDYALATGPQFVRAIDRNSTADEIEARWTLSMQNLP